MVVRVGEGEVRREADAVTHIVVQHESGGEAIQILLDDSTRLVVITSRNAEFCFLTTTRQRQIVVVCLAELVLGMSICLVSPPKSSALFLGDLFVGLGFAALIAAVALLACNLVTRVLRKMKAQ